LSTTAGMFGRGRVHDVLVFTGGVGEHAHEVRAAACDRLGFAGVRVDAERNRHLGGEGEISAVDAAARTFVVSRAKTSRSRGRYVPSWSRPSDRARSPQSQLESEHELELGDVNRRNLLDAHSCSYVWHGTPPSLPRSAARAGTHADRSERHFV
jgi:hypothetical protein